MGFYGNMTNSVKTNMTFDRKYSSRKNMDDMAASDGIYAGRYVLVEYGLDWISSVVSDTYNNTDINKIIKFYKYANSNNAIYKESSCQIRYEGAEEGLIFYIGGKRSGSRTETCDELWIYKNNKYNLITDKMLDRTTDANYVTNFNIDKEVYGAGRGYDSTVWTKTYGTDGIPRYVMIAELNAIIPTFTLSLHAPSANSDGRPFAPYFDELGTNVHYNMHVGTPWGMRIAETDRANSDMGTKAIYYNKAGFEEFNRNVINKEDFISITDAKSGYDEYVEGLANDIKELSIYLPSVGNMVAAGWDIIHGEDRKDNPATSLQGRLDFFKNMKTNEIPVQSSGGNLVGAIAVDDNWINCIVDAENKTITINHDFHSVTDTTSSLNKNNGEEINDNINLYTPIVDDKGHVVGKNIETVILPYGYKTFTIGEQSTGVEELITNTFEVVADNTQDSMTITSANKWIRLAGEEDKIQVAHAISAQTPITVGNETLSTKFGDSFNIPRFTTDEAGHIIAASDQIITLLAGSYTPDKEVSESTEAITSIGFNAATGAITSTKANSSTLKLTSYSAGTDTTDVADGDTYNDAFAKLQNQINGLDYSNSSTTQIITGITQTDGLISVTRGDAGTLVLTGYELKEGEGSDADLLAADNLKTAFSKLLRQIHVEEAARASVINALDYTDPDSATTTFVSKVTLKDGKIEVSHSNAGTLLLTDYNIGTSGEKIAATDSINVAFAKLLTQINNVIGSEEIATNFNNIKKISDWLSANDSDANKVIDDIATLKGDSSVPNSILNQIKSAIEGMVTESSNFTYPAIKDSNGTEISSADAAMTIALLFEKVAALEARIYALEHPTTGTPDSPPEEGGETPEEGGEETPTE